MVSLKQLFEWFTTGKFPTEAQFAEQFKSFWHKSERINQSSVLGLNEVLATKVDRDELISMGVGIKGYGDDVQNIDDLQNVPDKYEGMGVLVINDKDEDGNSYIWLYDGEKWGRTPFTSFPKDIVTKVNLSETNEITDLNSRIVYRGNLHNSNTDLIGKSLSNNGLVLTDTENYVLTDYILVDVGVAHRCTESMRKYWCFADKNSPALDFQESVNADVVPIGKYVRFIYSILVGSDTVLFGRTSDNLTGNAIPYSKYDDEILTSSSEKIQYLDEKVTYKPSANRHNPDTDLKGHSLSDSGLTLTETEAYTLTDYIEVQPNIAHRCTQSMRKFWSFADKNSPALEYISTSIGAGIKVTPIGKFVRFIYPIDIAGDNVRFGRSDDDIDIPYGETPYTKTDDEFLTPKSEQIVKLDEDVQAVDKKVVYKETANIHNPETDSLNTSLQANGTTIVSDTYNTSAFQKVDGGKEYRFVGLSGGTNTSGAYMRRIVEFDENYNVIKSTDSVQIITLDINTVYVRYMYHNVAIPSQVYFGLASADINVPYSERAYDRNGNKLLLNTDVIAASGERLITLQNSDKILFIGSSSTESHYALKFKSWFMKLNEELDWLFVTYAFSGNSAAQITAKLIANTPSPTAAGLTPDKIHPSYIHVGQFGNMSDSGLSGATSDDFIEANRQLILVAQSVFNAKAIIGTGYKEYGYSIRETGLKALADELGADFIPWGAYLDRILNNYKYAGFWGSAHPGTRTNNQYFQEALNFFEKWQMPKQSIKMYIPREGVTEYDYRNNKERAVKFRSIQVGEQSLPDDKAGYYDRLQTTSDYTPFIKNNSEYNQMIQGNTVNFGDVLLVEVILPVVSADTVNLYVQASDGLIFSFYNNLTSAFEEFSGVEYADGLYTLPVKDCKYISHDKIKLLITAPNVEISNVYCKFSGGREKQRIDKTSLIEYAGKALIGGNGFDDNWSAAWTGTDVTAYKQSERYGSADFIDIPSYLPQTSNILEIPYSNSIKGVRKLFTQAELYGDKHVSSPLHIRVEVYARMWCKIYDPDRYVAWVGDNNPYTDQPVLTTESYDYGTLCVGLMTTTNRTDITEKRVGMFWARHSFDLYLHPFAGNHSIRVFRKVNDMNSHLQMEIADIIVSTV